MKIVFKLFFSFLAVISLSFLVHDFQESQAITLLSAFLIAGACAVWVARSLTKPLRELSENADAIARGHFQKISLSESNEEITRLIDSFRQMSAILQRRFQGLQSEKEQLKAILNGMIEGVMVTDPAGRILLVNPALRELFELEGTVEGKAVIECIRHAELHESVDRVLETRTLQEQEILLTRGLPRLEERHFLVHTAPFSQEEGVGSVSVFYDISQIRKLENVRHEFVANVSHELKTPLTNILGYTETLRQGLPDTETLARFHEKIEKNAVQLKNLVEDILKLAEIESGKVSLPSSSFRVKEIVRAIQESLESTLRQKHLSVDLLIPDQLTIVSEPIAFRQIATNLLDNAVKYSADGGKIIVRTEIRDQTMILSVSDEGMGIPEKDLPRIFERFYRVDKSRSRDMGGTGLGLSIVKHLTQQLGGEIFVTSEPEKGSTFTLKLPLSK